MRTESFLTTVRLLIDPLVLTDGEFIRELVNTEGWLKFIGNRNVNSPEEAIAYIQKILANTNVAYWVVRLKENKESIGVITMIKRDYLEHHDIGFAFLPRFAKNGYAFEATVAVLNKLIPEQQLARVLAITIPENESSIMLLQKIGLGFEKEIEVENEKLYLYGASADRLMIS